MYFLITYIYRHFFDFKNFKSQKHRFSYSYELCCGLGSLRVCADSCACAPCECSDVEHDLFSYLMMMQHRYVHDCFMMLETLSLLTFNAPHHVHDFMLFDLYKYYLQGSK